jgi:ATP-binding cassette subfamily B protein
MTEPVQLGQKLQQALRLDKALRLVWRAAPGWTVANVVLVLLQSVLPLAGLYMRKRIFDALAVGLAGSDITAAFQQVLPWIVGAGALAIVIALLSSLSEIVGQAQSMTVTDAVSDVVHEKSIAVDLEYYEDPRYYDTLHRAQAEAPYRPTHIVNGLVQLGRNAISLAGLATLLVSANWAVGLLLLAAALPGALVRLVYSRKLFQFEREQAEADRRAWYYHWMMTNVGHAKEVRLFNLGSLFRERFRALRRQLREGRLKLAGQRSLNDLLTQLIATTAIYGTFGLIAYQAVSGQMTLGDVVMYYEGFQMGLGQLRALLQGLAGLYEDNLFLTNFYQFLDLEPRVHRPDHPQPVPVPMYQGVSFEQVRFVYPSGTRQVLDEVDLTIRPGEVIALVGENGSGKTTLIKLLCRLYDPTAGRIAVDGIDFRDLDPVEWRRKISVVFQDYVQYYLSARENIWLGNVALSPDSEAIELAARQSGAEAVIRRLPQGFDTLLGHQFRKGQELSIGEWQKVALARAFLRDARIVVLDEPTSFLDPLAEAELFAQFRKLIEGRMGVLISHRFSTVRMADTIYVLEGGRITERGSHDQLLRQGGTYAHLFEVQARNYTRGPASSDGDGPSAARTFELA